MSTERVNRNFQKFLQTIYHWPTPTIEKSILIRKLEELCRQNPELEHIYENIPITQKSDSTLKNGTAAGHSRSEGTENYLNPSASPNNIRQPKRDNNQSSTDKSAATKESDPVPNLILVKEGDLTVKKGSTILSPLMKKNQLKPAVYCELSYALSEGTKMVYLIVYQSRKCRKMVYTFLIDQTCSLVLENKKAFSFKHNSAVEKFTCEAGVADAWIASFDQATKVRQNTDGIVEDEYENPADLFTTSESSSFESLLEAPNRPPPRPTPPTNPISPENIYVCLYNHHPLTTNSRELEFDCGDLLYIINTDGPDFYVGHRLVLPLNNNSYNPTGLVFKDYVTPAYEKV